MRGVYFLLSLASVAEMTTLVNEELPSIAAMGVVFESMESGFIKARLPFDEKSLRPGATVSGPTMMALADIVTFACVLSKIGIVRGAVTTSLNANFLRKPGAVDLIAEGRLIKLGLRLAYGEVSIFSVGELEDVVCHVVCTYSIPNGRT